MSQSGGKKVLPETCPDQLNFNSDLIKLKSHERRIGNYILGRSIGEGTFGKVKIGVHIPTGEKVCALSWVMILGGSKNPYEEQDDRQR